MRRSSITSSGICRATTNCSPGLILATSIRKRGVMRNDMLDERIAALRRQGIVIREGFGRVQAAA